MGSVLFRIMDFGVDGGAAINAMEPKLELFKNHVFETLNFKFPAIEVQL